MDEVWEDSEEKFNLVRQQWQDEDDIADDWENDLSDNEEVPIPPKSIKEEKLKTVKKEEVISSIQDPPPVKQASQKVETRKKTDEDDLVSTLFGMEFKQKENEEAKAEKTQGNIEEEKSSSPPPPSRVPFNMKSLNLTSKKDFANFNQAFLQFLARHHSSPYYKDFVDELLKKLVREYSLNDCKKFSTFLTNLCEEMSKSKKNVKDKKNVIVLGKKATTGGGRAKKHVNFDDFLVDEDEEYEDEDDY